MIHGAVKLELQPQRRVQKGIAQIVRHQPCGEVFAPGGQILLIRLTGAHPLPQGVELRIQVDGQAAVVGDLLIPLADQIENFLAADAVFQVSAAQIQKVGDLMVVLISFAGGGHHDNAAGVVALHNGLDLGKLHGVGHGGAAEFCYFQHINSPFVRCKAFSLVDKKTETYNLSSDKKHLTFYGKQYIISLMKMQGEISAFFEKIFRKNNRRSIP